MNRITTLASGTVGLVSGAVGMAMPMTLGMSPLNSFATGATMAVGVGLTCYQLWHGCGQKYLAGYLAKQVDSVFKANRESIHQVVEESIKSKLPQILTSNSLADVAVKSIINSRLDNYSTDPQIVRKILDDLDRRVPYENNDLLRAFVNQATNSILEAKCSGCYTPLQPILRKPLKRIVAISMANFLKKTTEVGVAKARESYIGNAVNAVENYFQTDFNKTLNWGLGLV
ncbi:MAG: hypothetical protein H0X29_01185 [Parachlamydiaceae bacterium]|nr:hypothetical protein [Parachlamydiaceae bacterium]